MFSSYIISLNISIILQYIITCCQEDDKCSGRCSLIFFIFVWVVNYRQLSITFMDFLCRKWMLVVAIEDFPTTYAKLDVNVNTSADV
jgi:hypothetical protein